ncbi:hypothetical protein BC940DRAFT_307707 [Gongronella butleri]|nr:hypothetical protein BC940DRAFT_307707 [Gongronella butleri]
MLFLARSTLSCFFFGRASLFQERVFNSNGTTSTLGGGRKGNKTLLSTDHLYLVGLHSTNTLAFRSARPQKNAPRLS